MGNGNDFMKIGDVFTDFIEADSGTKGGYARVLQVKKKSDDIKGPSELALKIMRSDVVWQQGFTRFVEEIKVLSFVLEKSKENNTPVYETINKLYGFGFLCSRFSASLEKQVTYDCEMLVCDSLEEFVLKGNEFLANSSIDWVPFVLLELANFDDSLFRKIATLPKDEQTLYRIPTGEIILMSVQLLDVLEFLHSEGYAYIDWKPEHVHWNGETRKAKLIDWNVTCPLDAEPGAKQNILDDVRMFCGAILYSSITMVDLSGKQLGARPTTKEYFGNPVMQARMRYAIDDVIFYKAYKYLDEHLVEIIRKGLSKKNSFKTPYELKKQLIEYAQESLGVDIYDVNDPYFNALASLREAEGALRRAYSFLGDATLKNGPQKEFDRVSKIILRAQNNLHLP